MAESVSPLYDPQQSCEHYALDTKELGEITESAWANANSAGLDEA